MIVLTDTCAVMMLIRIVPDMFIDSRYGCVTIQTVYEEIRQTAKFAKKYPWRNDFLKYLNNAIFRTQLQSQESYLLNKNTVEIAQRVRKRRSGSFYGLSEEDREVLIAALTLRDQQPKTEKVNICTTDGGLAEFSSRLFSVKNISPLQLINLWLRQGLITWDANRQNLLYEWISNDEPYPREEAIREFEELTGERFPKL